MRPRRGVLGLALFTVAVLAVTIKSANAQTQEPIWFWAWRSYDLEVEQAEDQLGDLLAFTPDGIVNVLLENVFPIVLERIDENRAFVTGKIDDTYNLYYLTSTDASAVMELFDQSYVEELRQNAIYDGYTYFTPEIIPAGENRYLIADTKRDQYAIFDSAKHITMFVNLRAWCKDDCVRVSADGRYIRYRVSPSDPMQTELFSDPGENALPYQIYEYDTTTETERLIYQHEVIDFIKGQATPPQADCTPDEYGDRWYCELFLDDNNNPGWVADEKIIVYIDGSIEQVDVEWKLRVFNNRWYFLDLDKIRSDCDPCVINVFPDGNKVDAFQFVAPPRSEFGFWYDEVRMLSEQHLTPTLSGMPIYAFSRSGELTELGARPCCADPISQDYYDEATGWMVVINITDPDMPQTEIWNTRPLERIASVSVNIQPGVRSTFRNYSFVLFDRGPAVVYSYFDKVLYEFSFTEYRTYIDAFPGGLLFVDYGGEYGLDGTYEYTKDAIYRWTSTEGEKLLIDGAIYIPNGQ